jgi:hypothetical protein
MTWMLRGLNRGEGKTVALLHPRPRRPWAAASCTLGTGTLSWGVKAAEAWSAVQHGNIVNTQSASR